jgi:hypothetical protein
MGGGSGIGKQPFATSKSSSFRNRSSSPGSGGCNSATALLSALFELADGGMLGEVTSVQCSAVHWYYYVVAWS